MKHLNFGNYIKYNFHCGYIIVGANLPVNSGGGTVWFIRKRGNGLKPTGNEVWIIMWSKEQHLVLTKAANIAGENVDSAIDRVITILQSRGYVEE